MNENFPQRGLIKKNISNIYDQHVLRVPGNQVLIIPTVYFPHGRTVNQAIE